MSGMKEQLIPSEDYCKILLFQSLTLFPPAYWSISKNRRGGGAHCAPLNIFGLGGVRVPILVGNDLPRHDLPCSKGFMKF